VLAYHQLRTFTEDGLNTNLDSYTFLGADMKPFTGDETYGFRQRQLFDVRGLLTRRDQVSAPGGDGEWFTGDDASNGYTTFDYDAAGRMTGWRELGFGADGLWFTRDDNVVSYGKYVHAANGQRESMLYCDGAGTDDTWFTADDSCDSYRETYEYARNGLLERELYYSNQKVTEYIVYEYESEGRLKNQLSYDVGSDGVYDTDDDYVTVEWIYAQPR